MSGVGRHDIQRARAPKNNNCKRFSTSFCIPGVNLPNSRMIKGAVTVIMLFVACGVDIFGCNC